MGLVHLPHERCGVCTVRPRSMAVWLRLDPQSSPDVFRLAAGRLGDGEVAPSPFLRWGSLPLGPAPVADAGASGTLAGAPEGSQCQFLLT